MLLLVSTTDKVQLVTSAAGSIDVHASYVDYSAPSTVTPGRKNTAITTAVTTDIVSGVPASTQRNVKLITVRNKHASNSCDITLIHTDGTTAVELDKVTLAPGEMYQYQD